MSLVLSPLTDVLLLATFLLILVGLQRWTVRRRRAATGTALTLPRQTGLMGLGGGHLPAAAADAPQRTVAQTGRHSHGLMRTPDKGGSGQTPDQRSSDMARLQAIVDRSLARAEAMSHVQSTAETQLDAAEAALERMLADLKSCAPALAAAARADRGTRVAVTHVAVRAPGPELATAMPRAA